MRYLGWSLQVLILAIGIHLFLRFVRTTRGNRLIRGLFLSVVVGVVGLWGFSRALELEELEHLLESSSGFIVIGLVVIFQSELRRGIAQLGEHSLLGLVPSSGGGAAREAVEAARSLAALRRGALIVFERETSLQPVIESGTPIDAEVKAPLLESLFHPDSPRPSRSASRHSCRPRERSPGAAARARASARPSRGGAPCAPTPWCR
jgi:diadenylate cyclase